ncbi:TetR/AcrR family transcriptional regulator [Xenophilus sp.]|mgnify:CR=1 FL=1|uniref:TetR/AcrR family transcriptional regulator n=1 Tax=Xenophilus sp. TaxID=1873499 RepID=UPI0037DD4A35
MTRKAPRRTAQRILEAALDLFNRFGEPNVSTTLIAAELGISPGNLYYHYPAKDTLVNRLHEEFEAALAELLADGPRVREVAAAHHFVAALFHLIWRYRFLYRDQSDLLSRNRHLEARLQKLLLDKETALRSAIAGLAGAGHLAITADEADTLARSMVVVLTYWLNFEYATNPREALEPAHADQALARGCRHVLQLVTPYMPPASRAQLPALDAVPATEDDAAEPA